MYAESFGRNIGFLTHEEQKKISELSIAIAGAGGDGGLLAERLVRFGIGKILLADPENFELNNINRQFAAHTDNMGANKARVVSRYLKAINPRLQIQVFEEGVTTENVAEFVSQAEIIVDEIEYTVPELSVMLARQVRKQGKLLFMGANVGWGASIFCFHPEGVTFEEYFDYDDQTKSIDPKKYVNRIPEYIDQEMLEKVLAGEMPMPSLSSSVSLVAALLSSRIILAAVKNINPPFVPNVFQFDAFNLKVIEGDAYADI
jgi:molybdopterin/thiamine biosynthesis adenylyltransferase